LPMVARSRMERGRVTVSAGLSERFAGRCRPGCGGHSVYNDGGCRLISVISGILSRLMMLPPL
jgi:hypothetical protein